MCFIMSEKVNQDITQASQIMFLDISMRRFTVHVDLHLPSSRAQSESGRFFISFFWAKSKREAKNFEKVFCTRCFATRNCMLKKYLLKERRANISKGTT